MSDANKLSEIIFICFVKKTCVMKVEGSLTVEILNTDKNINR